MKTGTFNVSDLVECYAPPNLRSVMPGNRVMLRSGGPEMTVIGMTHTGHVACNWMVNGLMHGDSFDLECLTCYGAK
ncbi:DUF2158 domain-containing protein [Massilia antarctica]|uniref:DUF2158 domain-containing protein n=1 Tax=Massilia antarctica TaxID=2765360 RepID=UPI00226F97DC|nr:DUF2158 domain-containing protein [Massilia sp. H27-R4]MCY0910853.1 DUF2158 domain-containing protein [Massilia sp. H27-R4]